MNPIKRIKLEEDMDVTELLGVTKYDPADPVQLAGLTKGKFPDFVHKTDETRIQNLQPLLTYCKGTLCFVTEKLEGSSSTHYFKDGVFGVCSRNLELQETDDNTHWKLAREYDLENKLRKLGRNLALQGELIGEGVQGNIYKLKGHHIYFFNIFDIDKQVYLSYQDFLTTCEELDIKHAPVLDCVYQLTDDIPTLVQLSIGYSELNNKVKREGIVIRPLIEQYHPRYGRISFKSINPEYLLEYGK